MSEVFFPECWHKDIWHGYERRYFDVDGYHAWVVIPEAPLSDHRWSWCTCWPDSFVERVGIIALLQQGYYHAHIDVYDTAANDVGIAVMAKFQEQLTTLGLKSKVNLIGMSWGGYFALRYAEEFPERIAAIYLDAPVCNAADPHPSAALRVAKIADRVKIALQELGDTKYNPLTRVECLVKAGIPLLAATGETDQSVSVESNINLLEQRLLACGGSISIIRRDFWGHHPHGFDDPSELVKFHQAAHQ